MFNISESKIDESNSSFNLQKALIDFEVNLFPFYFKEAIGI